MSTIVVLGILAFGCLLVGMIGYSTITDSIIKDQRREIARLRTENKRLEAALHGMACAKVMRVYREPINQPECTIVRNDGEDPFALW